MRASTSSENISRSRAPGSDGGARCGRCCRFRLTVKLCFVPFLLLLLSRCGWELIPSSLRRILFFLRNQRDVLALASDSSVDEGEAECKAAAAALISSSGSGFTVAACCIGESQSVEVEEAGEGAD